MENRDELLANEISLLLRDDYTKGPEENSRKCGTEWVQSPQGIQQDVVIVHQGAKETV